VLVIKKPLNKKKINSQWIILVNIYMTMISDFNFTDDVFSGVDFVLL